MVEQIVSVEDCRKLFEYDPITGVITNRTSRGGRTAAGHAESAIDKGGYVYAWVSGKKVRAHRIAWALYYGVAPSGHVDHINGVRSDNRIVNLRDAPQRSNRQNVKRPAKSNKSGYLGVSRDKKTGRWKAQIGVRGKCINLGRFDSPEDAHLAYVTAKRIHHEGCTL